MATRVKV